MVKYPVKEIFISVHRLTIFYFNVLCENLRKDISLNILDLDILDGLESFAGKVEAFQLAEEPEFDKIYVDYMNFDIQQGDI